MTRNLTKNLNFSRLNTKKVNDSSKKVHLTGTDIVPVFSFCYVGFVKRKQLVEPVRTKHIVAQNGEYMAYAIEINNLTKSYGRNRGVIDVSLKVEEGDIFGFIGPNGAGKSTTIRSMLGFLKFETGEIKILGMDSVKDHEKILRNVGYMPSEAWFYNAMKVSDVIKYAADVRGLDCSAEAEKLCERLKVNTDKKIKELSLGNRKKVSIVCAMQHKPKLFIFDEPTGGLDPLMQKHFFELINEYVSEGATCLLSTHVLSEVNKYCRNAAIMREGQLTMLDSPKIDDDTFLSFYED